MTFTNANNATYNLQATYKGAVYTKADVTAWIKKQWATMVRRELEQDLLLRRFVMNVSFPQGKVGDTVTIPTIGRLGVNRKIAGVPVTLQKGNTGSWSINVTQYAEASFMTEDITSIMLDPSGMLANNLAKEAAYAIKRDLDAYILGLRAAVQAIGGTQVIFSSNNGLNTSATTSNPLNIGVLLRAKLAMDNLDVPMTGRVWIVSPTQYMQLLSLDKVQSMFYRTSAPLENGIVGTLLGTPVYMTSMVGANSTTGFLNGGVSIPTPGVVGAGQVYYPDQDTAATLPTTWNTTLNTTPETQAVHTALLLQSDAFALAMLQEPKTEYSRETLYLADAVVTTTLYGARMYRPNNAVIVHTNATLPVS
jgi:Phage capsid protein